jgi:hypothetical protein
MSMTRRGELKLVSSKWAAAITMASPTAVPLPEIMARGTASSESAKRLAVAASLIRVQSAIVTCMPGPDHSI